MKMRNGWNPKVYAAIVLLILVGLGVSLLMSAAIVEFFK